MEARSTDRFDNRGSVGMKLGIRAFAVTTAIVCGGGLFLVTWWIIGWEGVSGEPTFIGRVYPGYNLSPTGSVIGLVWGFLDGLVGGALFAWIYNTVNALIPSSHP
jgi:hypothetical protein